MLGGVVSVTLTEKLQLELKPELSNAVQVTYEIPSPKVTGVETVTLGVQEILAMPLPSEAMVSVLNPVSVTEAVKPLMGERVIFIGHEMLGGVESATRTANEHEAELPALSVARHVTEESPNEKRDPEAGLQTDELIPELSTAEKLQVAKEVGVLPFVGVSNRGTALLYGGQERVGLVESAFATVNAQEETLSALFVAEH